MIIKAYQSMMSYEGIEPCVRRANNYNDSKQLSLFCITVRPILEMFVQYRRASQAVSTGQLVKQGFAYKGAGLLSTFFFLRYPRFCGQARFSIAISILFI